MSYLGLNPRVKQSGGQPASHGQITKQGRANARGMLVEAAWAAAKTSTSPLALVRYLPGANRKRMQAELAALPGVTAVSDSRALLDSFNKLLGFFYAIVAIMLICGGALAFALLYSTITTSTAERTTELATLRAAGAQHRTLARMITAENALTITLAIPPGLIAGYLTARAFMASFNSDAYSFNLQMRPSTLVLSALAMLLVALISQRPSLRAIQRLDIARIVRERSL